MGSVSQLPVAVRAYTRRPPQDEEESTRGAHDEPKWPPAVLVFDTETTTDERQTLLFGTARYCRLIEGAYRCVSEELFYADELSDDRPEEFERLQDYAGEHDADVIVGGDPELRLRSRTEFVREVLYRAAFEGEAAVVGFNLPFDLTRLAIHFGEARRDMYGGFSLGVFGRVDPETGEYSDRPKDPRIVFKTIDSKRAFIRFGSPGRTDSSLVDSDSGRSPSGRFLDLRTLAFSLTSRGHTLRSACEAFRADELPEEAEQHGEVTAPYISYNRRDVRCTHQLLNRLKREYDRHPIDREPDRTYSPASLAKSYLEGMGVRPPREKFEVDPRVYGRVMETYFGGRAEARIRKTPVPVVYLDFLSMYPTVNSLMDLWAYLRAESVETREVTGEAQQLLENVSTDRVFNPKCWPHFRFFARVRPDSDILPVRAEYDEDSRVPNIGVNRFSAEEGFWYAGPDLVASTLLTGKAPEVLEAFRIVPRGVQSGLQPIDLRGTVTVDPADEDFFRKVIEARKSLDQRNLNDTERARRSRFLKILANAGSYGIYAEMIRQRVPESRPEEIEVYGRGQGFTRETDTPETPGTYCFPPVASLTSSGARLMLALLERCVRDRGGSYAFCDTDSMAVLASQSGERPDGRGGLLRGSSEPPACHSAESEKATDSLKSTGGRQGGIRGGDGGVKGGRGGSPQGPLAGGQAGVGREEGGPPKDPSTPSPEAPKGGGEGASPLEYRVLRWQDVREIVRRFEALNPYDRDVVPGSVLEVEEENFQGGDPENEQVQLNAYVLSAKRYVLFRGVPGSDDFEIIKHSEHGLGHLLDPTDPEGDSNDWIEYVWRRMLREGFGASVEEPEWFDRIAASRLTVSAPHYSRMFEAYNEGKPYREQVKPMNFMLSAHLKPLGAPAGFEDDNPQPVAPYESDSSNWKDLDWIDKSTGEPAYVTTGTGVMGPELPVKTYRDVYREYRSHPEVKSAASDGGRCDRNTRGLLRRRHVRPLWIQMIGKEANRLEEVQAGQVQDLDDVLEEYSGTEERWNEVVRPILKQIPARRLAALTNTSHRWIRKVRNRDNAPAPTLQKTLSSIIKKVVLHNLNEATDTQ